MMVLKNKLVYFLIIIFVTISIDLVSTKTAMPADNSQIVIDGNLKAGMVLKDALELLGSPEKITVTNNGTVIIPYETLGLFIEVMSGETVIERIHVQSSFKGRFASGIEIGSDAQKILSVYNQPDIITKEVMEYSDPARRFQIHEGRLAQADLYSSKSTMYNRVSDKISVKTEVIPEELREALREELRSEIREEVREEFDKEIDEEFDVFDLYGLKARQTSTGVIISEIRPGSAADKGGLKVGEPVRRAFYEGAIRLNIYSVKGLEAILRRAVVKRKRVIEILQDENYYYRVEVPRRL